MPSTTPAGCRTPIASEPGTSDGISSPPICVVSAAASTRPFAASSTLNRAQIADAPVSAAIAAMNASRLPSSAAAAFSSSARRALGPSAAHGANAADAASTAARASAAVAAGARVASSPSSGLRRSNVAPPVAGRRSPPISIEMSCMRVFSF